METFGEIAHHDAHIPVANKACWLLTWVPVTLLAFQNLEILKSWNRWVPITEGYFFKNTGGFPLLYQREDEPLIPEMVYKVTHESGPRQTLPPGPSHRAAALPPGDQQAHAPPDVRSETRPCDGPHAEGALQAVTVLTPTPTAL